MTAPDQQQQQPAPPPTPGALSAAVLAENRAFYLALPPMGPERTSGLIQALFAMTDALAAQLAASERNRLAAASNAETWAKSAWAARDRLAQSDAALRAQQAVEDHELECEFCIYADFCNIRAEMAANAGVARADYLAAAPSSPASPATPTRGVRAEAGGTDA